MLGVHVSMYTTSHVLELYVLIWCINAFPTKLTVGKSAIAHYTCVCCNKSPLGYEQLSYGYVYKPFILVANCYFHRYLMTQLRQPTSLHQYNVRQTDTWGMISVLIQVRSQGLTNPHRTQNICPFAWSEIMKMNVAVHLLHALVLHKL